MELLVEIIIELVLGGSIDGAADEGLPRWARIALLTFATLAYVAITLGFVWMLWSAEGILVKIILAGIVLLFVAAFIHMWRKVAKAKA